MSTQAISAHKDDYLISTDKALLDVAVIQGYLSRSYWAKDIPVTIVQHAIEGSLCFGIYHTNKQIGFARVISDFATFAYLADVFVLEEHRGKGLSKWLMHFIMHHPNLQGLRRFMLATRDAHKLYEQFGFKLAEKPENIMEIRVENIYSKQQAS